jgi:expansin (peptidoglycan-binding protein)
VNRLSIEIVTGVVALAIQAGVAVWWASGIQSKLYHIEHQVMKLDMNVEQNTEFRIKWPRGEMGALPDDVRQDSAITVLQAEVERLRERTQCR